MKYSWKKYWEPTPKLIRRIADSLLGSAMLISSISFINDYKTLAFTVLIIAGIAKFLSNFFSIENEIEDTNNS